MVILEHGDIFASDADIICHQVNMQGVMGEGIAKIIKLKYPIVFEKYNQYTPSASLGDILLVKVSDKLIIANLYGQKNYGLSQQQTSYEAIACCLNKVKEYAKYKKLKIAIPYGMSCCRGGGDWRILTQILEKIFSDYDVYIYKL